MRNSSYLRKSLIATAVMMAFAAVPFSLMAQSTSPSSMPQQQPSTMQQTTPTTDQSTMTRSSSNETVPGKVDDSWITTKVKSELLADSMTKGLDINVKTSNGVVALSGTVSNDDAADHVKDIARKVKGVKSVDASGLKTGGA